MSAAHQPRRAVAEIRWATDPGAIVWVGGRTLYHYWPVLSSYFRDLLLPPQRRAEEENATWSWREPASQAEFSASELSTVRKRLERDQQMLAENLAREIGRAQQAGGAQAQAGIEQLPAVMARVVAQLVGRDDAGLAGYLCRTEAGVRLHSWGAFVPARVTYPEGRACEVSGRVLVAGQPAARCEVFLTAENGSPVAQARTDGVGAFRLPDVAAGRYRLQAQASAAKGKFPAPGLAVVVDKEPVADLELSYDPTDEPAAAPASGARWGRPVAWAAAILSVVVVAIWWWRRPSEAAPAVASVASAAPHQKETEVAGAQKVGNYKSDTVSRNLIPADKLPLGASRLGAAGLEGENRSAPATTTASGASTPTTSSAPSGGVPTADTQVERAIAVPVPAGLPGAPGGTPGSAPGQPEQAGQPGAAAGTAGGDQKKGAASTAKNSSSPNPATTTRAASPAEKSVAPKTPPQRTVAVQADSAPPTPPPERKAKKDLRSEKPSRSQKSSSAEASPTSDTPAVDSPEASESENPRDVAGSTETASTPKPDAETPAATAVKATSSNFTGSATADVSSADNASPDSASSDTPSESKDASSPDADSPALAARALPPAEAPTAIPASAFARTLHLGWMPWQCRIIADTIVPTAPTRVGKADSVRTLREKLRIAQDAAQPRAFRAPTFRSGLVFTLPPEITGPLRWHDAPGQAPATATVTFGGDRAELTWPGIALPAGTHWTLRRADGTPLVELASSATATTLRLAEGVRATFSVALISADTESGSADAEGVSTFAAASPFTWCTADGGPLPPPYTESSGARFQLPLDQLLAGSLEQRLALLDPASGWALVGGLRFSPGTLTGGQP